MNSNKFKKKVLIPLIVILLVIMPVIGSLPYVQVSAGSLDLENIRTKMYTAINDQRTRNGLSKLIYDDRLEIVSQKHAVYMTENYLNKMDGASRNPGRRLEAEGIKWWAIGENIGLREITSDIVELFEKEYWMYKKYGKNEDNNRFDEDFTNIAIGLAINEERNELYICVDYYTPYTNQKERKRPYAELTPVNLHTWKDEEKIISYACFSFRNTGNTNLTNIQININFTNLEDRENIIANGSLDFQNVLTPGQVVTVFYHTEAGFEFEKEDYIHIYNIISFEITTKALPDHHFSKHFTISYDEEKNVSLDARLINTSDKTFSFYCYATYFTPAPWLGAGYITPIGKSEQISKVSIQPNTGRDIHIPMGLVNPERKDFIMRVEITYWIVEE